MSSPRHKWEQEGGRSVILFVFKANNAPEHIMRRLESMGLRELYNKRDMLVAYAQYMGRHWSNGTAMLYAANPLSYQNMRATLVSFNG